MQDYPHNQTETAYKEPPIFKLNISEKGQFNLESGDNLDERTQELIQQALDQAAYMAAKSHKAEEQKQKQLTEIDSIIVVFAAFLLSLSIFATWALVSLIVSKVSGSKTTQEPVNSSYVINKEVY